MECEEDDDNNNDNNNFCCCRMDKRHVLQSEVKVKPAVNQLDIMATLSEYLHGILSSSLGEGIAEAV
jgi:hypothetical protein